MINTNRAKAAHITLSSQAIARHPRVKHFRNAGMIWAFDVLSSDPLFARNFYQAALAKELLLRPFSTTGNTVYFMPPYVISNEEIALLTNRTLEIINT